MTLTQLRAVLAIYESGSIQIAAESLGISRATVRQLIVQLEDALGAKLFLRSHTGTRATPAGEELIPQARALVRDAGALERRFKFRAQEAWTDLHVQVPPGLPTFLHAAAALSIVGRDPTCRLKISLMGSARDPFPQDVHLRIQFGAAPPSGPYRTFVIARLEEQLLSTPDYLERHGTPTSLADLEGHRLLSWIPPDEDGRQWPLYGGSSLQVEPTFLSEDVALLRQLMHIGGGIAYVPNSSLIPDRPEAECVPVLPDLVGRACMLRVVIPEALAELQATRALIDLTRELVESAPEGLLTWDAEL